VIIAVHKNVQMVAVTGTLVSASVRLVSLVLRVTLPVRTERGDRTVLINAIASLNTLLDVILR
jgi:hypothetical protein